MSIVIRMSVIDSGTQSHDLIIKEEVGFIGRQLNSQPFTSVIIIIRLTDIVVNHPVNAMLLFQRHTAREILRRELCPFKSLCFFDNIIQRHI